MQISTQDFNVVFVCFLGSERTKTFKIFFPLHFAHLASVTRLGNLLDFGQLLKAFGNN